jgi:GNAT superfamily N-acetyltransferase
VLGTPDEALHRARFLQWIRAPHSFTLLAEQGQQIIGFLAMYLMPRLNVVRPQAWIPDLIVTKAARGQGIGYALLERAEAIAEEACAFILTLKSPPWRTQAHALYNRYGMGANAVQFEKRLIDIEWRAVRTTLLDESSRPDPVQQQSTAARERHPDFERPSQPG